MTSLASSLSPSLARAESVQSVELTCFTYGHPIVVLDGMLGAMNHSGCWLESRRAVSSSQIEMCIVTALGTVDELYCGFIAAGVELPLDSHRAFTWLCTLHRHRKDSAASVRTVSIRLQMHFLNEPQQEMGFVSAGMA